MAISRGPSNGSEKMTYVLIIVAWTVGDVSGTHNIRSIDFTNKAACETARTAMIDQAEAVAKNGWGSVAASRFLAVCVAK